MVERVDILGVGVDTITREGALARIESFVRVGGSHQVVTVNPEFVMQARSDAEFRRVLNGADLALADGIGVVWAARLLHRRLPERVPGSDLVLRIAQRAAEVGWRLYLLGSSPGVAERTAQVLVERYPGLQIAGTYAGSPASEVEETIIKRVAVAYPDILFVAYGAPAQDKWIARNSRLLGVSVAMGVGGAFDFIAGRAKRAPHWLQCAGLEWLHRLLREPWRWRRMLALPRFALVVMACRWKQARAER